MSKEKRAFWFHPWSYKESFVIVASLALVGIGFEYIISRPAPVILWPLNVYILGFFISFVSSFTLIAKNTEFYKWIAGIPSSIAALIFFVSVSLLMALVPQHNDVHSLWFLYNVTSSWLYYIAVAYFLIVLGLVSVRRLFPISKRNIGFFLNHTGLWIALAAASFGAGDIQKYSMVLQEGKTVWSAYDKVGQEYTLDFAIKLKNFEMEEYPGKIAFVDARSGEFLDNNGKKAIFELDTLHDIEYKDYSISVKDFLLSSVVYNNKYVPHYDFGATQSCFVNINKNSKPLMNGWIGAESITQAQNYIFLPDSVVLVLLKPEAKRFVSYFTVYEQTSAIYDTIIEVNKPINISGWKVYQTSYDVDKGKWSDISILEIVKDPWLHLVYVGFFLMMFGSVYLIWFGRNTKKS